MKQKNFFSLFLDYKLNYNSLDIQCDENYKLKKEMNLDIYFPIVLLVIIIVQVKKKRKQPTFNYSYIRIYDEKKKNIYIYILFK